MSTLQSQLRVSRTFYTPARLYPLRPGGCEHTHRWCGRPAWWTGIPLEPSEAGRRTRQITRRFDAAGAVAPRHWRARFDGRRLDAWAARRVHEIRSGRRHVPRTSVAGVIAGHRDPEGRLLDARVAGVELLDVLRPIVAVSVYLTFVGATLERFPQYRRRIAGGDASYAEWFLLAGGGDVATNHRCPGESTTLALMRAWLHFLVDEIRYRVPPPERNSKGGRAASTARAVAGLQRRVGAAHRLQTCAGCGAPHCAAPHRNRSARSDRSQEPPMMRRTRHLPPSRRLLALPLCAALGLACTETRSDAGAEDPGASPGATGEAAIDVRDGSPYGAHLVDAQGRSLYVFTADQHVPGSACLRACAEEWPPLVARRSPRLMDPALDPERVGTVRRTDGALQVTYAAWPLYRHRDDHAPGDVRRQEPRAFAGEWYLLSPDGETIEIDAASTSETPDAERNRPDTPRPVLHPERIARLAPSLARAGS